MSIAEKLTSILDTKQAIKEAIIEKGVSEVSDVFSEYPSYILNIPSGGGEPSEPEDPEPDEPIEEWVYPEDWPDLEQVLADNQIEGYPYRIIQLLGKGTTTTSTITSKPKDSSNSYLSYKIKARTSDGGEYEYYTSTNTITHTWDLNVRNNYRWIIHYFKDQVVNSPVFLEADLLCVIYDGIQTKLKGDKTLSNTSSEGYVENRNILQYIKGINGASIIEVLNYSFYNCYSLKKIDIPIGRYNNEGSNVYCNLFEGCKSLLEVPDIDAFWGTSFSKMFYGCSSLRSIPESIKTDKGTIFNYMFNGCSSLRSIPETIKTDNGISFSNMFKDCSSLRSIPETIKTDKGTNFSYMFNGCSTLISIPETIKTDNGTNFSNMFQGCSNLREIENINLTSSSSSPSNIFYGTINLRSIKNLILGNKITNPSIFDSSNGIRIKDLSIDVTYWTGSSLNSSFVNYMPSLTNFESLGTINANINFSNCLLLTYPSLVNILASLGETTSTKTLSLGATNLPKLTDEEKAIATEKGWTLS